MSFNKLTKSSAGRLQEGVEANLIAELHAQGQYIVSHAMCDDIAGTARQAKITPEIPCFLPQQGHKSIIASDSKPVCPQIHPSQSRPVVQRDYFDGDDLELDDFLAAPKLQKPKLVEKPSKKPDSDVEWISIDSSSSPPRHPPELSQGKDKEWMADMGPSAETDEPVRLANGNWACNHKCKDKTRDGLEKPPKPGKSKTSNFKSQDPSQLTLSASINEKKTPKSKLPATPKPIVKRKASQLSQSGTNPSNPPVKRRKSKQTQINYKQGGKSVLPAPTKYQSKASSRVLSSDYEDIELDDLPSPSTFLGPTKCGPVRPGSTCSTTSQPKETEPKFIDPSMLTLTGSDTLNDTDVVLRDASPGVIIPEHGMNQPDNPTQKETEVWEGTLSDATPVFTSPETLKSFATSLSLPASPENALRSPKGKEKVLEITNENLEQPSFNQYPLMDTLHELLSVPAAVVSPKTDQYNEESVNGDEEAGGWEDIDRMLYEEYKNIFNFY